MLDNLSLFGFRALWSPYYLSAIILITLAYLWLFKGKRLTKFSDATPATSKQVMYFLSAMLVLYIIKGSPVDLLGHLNMSMHMTQMALLNILVPPLLILGIPDWFFRKVLNKKIFGAVFKFLTKPLIALFLFNGLFSFYHFPAVFDIIKTDSILHAIVTTLIFIGAFVMWWPLFCPLPEYDTMSDLQKIGYIFADGVLLTPACALIIFAPEAMYNTYTDPVLWMQALQLCVPADILMQMDASVLQMFSWFDPRTDQQLGGVIMKIFQEVFYGIFLGFTFFKWVKKERAQDEIDAQQMFSPQPTTTE